MYIRSIVYIIDAYTQGTKNMDNEIYTNGHIVLGGKPTNFYVGQWKSGTKVFWCNRLKPRIRVSIDMPQNRYSLVSETPACGNGRSLFFRDLAQAISEHKRGVRK